MSPSRRQPRFRHIVLTLLVLVFGVRLASAEPIFAVTVGDVLVSFDSATPGAVTTIGAISGLNGGDLIVGIDFRPQTGQLYAVGAGSTLYTLDTLTAVATLVNFVTTTLVGTEFGVDFNPVPDRLRVTSDADQNLRLNPNNAVALVDGALAYNSVDPNAGVNPNIVGSAYTNSFFGATTTTLFGIDSVLDILVTQFPPNAGVLNTVGALGVDTSDQVGFDISGASGVAFASLTSGGVSRLYTIDLATGAATLVGLIGTRVGITSLSVGPADVPEPTALLLLATGLVALARNRRRLRS